MAALTEGIPNAVLVAVSVMVASFVVRAVGMWFVRSVGREFRSAVTAIVFPDLHPLVEDMARLRAEQTEQHGEVREEVRKLATNLQNLNDESRQRHDRLTVRIDGIETRLPKPVPRTRKST